MKQQDETAMELAWINFKRTLRQPIILTDCRNSFLEGWLRGQDHLATLAFKIGQVKQPPTREDIKESEV